METKRTDRIALMVVLVLLVAPALLATNFYLISLPASFLAGLLGVTASWLAVVLAGALAVMCTGWMLRKL